MDEPEEEKVGGSSSVNGIVPAQTATASTTVPVATSSGPPPSPGTIRSSGKYTKPFK